MHGFVAAPVVTSALPFILLLGSAGLHTFFEREGAPVFCRRLYMCTVIDSLDWRWVSLAQR